MSESKSNVKSQGRKDSCDAHHCDRRETCSWIEEHELHVLNRFCHDMIEDIGMVMFCRNVGLYYMRSKEHHVMRKGLHQPIYLA